MPTDDTGAEVPLDGVPRRIVSLVPSLTEAVAATAPGTLVGATDWCTAPADLAVTRVRGTKNPDLEAVVDLGPDLVVANAEENRAVDLAALRARGIAVWVTDIETVPQALTSLGRLTAVLGAEGPGWLAAAAAEWSAPWTGPVRSAVVPIWRRPWMALGRNTYAGDVLARVGVRNVLDGAVERYPKVELAALPQHDLVVLPSEPYTFSATDGPECFAAPAALVDGRLLTWYGPAMVGARAALTAQLAVLSGGG